MLIFYYLILFGLPTAFAILVFNHLFPIGRVLPILFASAQLFGALKIYVEKNRKQALDTTDVIIMWVYFSAPILVYLFIFILNFVREKGKKKQ